MKILFSILFILWICGAALLAASFVAQRWVRSNGLRFKKTEDGKTLLTMESAD